MKRIEHQDIEEALKTLGLDEDAMPQDIKRAYYTLARKSHPDTCKDKRKKRCEERFKKINHAYKVLRMYCKEHGHFLSKKEVKKNILGEEYYNHLKRFYDGWWGNLDL